MSDWFKNYPNRYYAYNTDYSTSNAVILELGYMIDTLYVAGWVDVAMFTTIPSWLPPASKMLAVSKDEWDNRTYLNKTIYNGKIYTFEPANP